MKNLVIAGAAVLALAAAAPDAGAHDFIDENGDGINDVSARRHRFGRGLIIGMYSTQLTDEQEAALEAQLEALKESGATGEEVAAAIRASLVGFGIDIPDYADHVVARYGTSLTDAQESELQALADGLEAAGSTNTEIKDAVDAKLAEFGIDLSTLTGLDHNVARLSAVLTDAQEAELQALIDGLEGASRSEMHAAIEAKLAEFGVASPSRGDHFVSRIGNLLTDAQEVELQSLIDGLRTEGATREEVRDAVDAKLAEYGVEAPAGGPKNGRGGPEHGRRGGPGGRRPGGRH